MFRIKASGTSSIAVHVQSHWNRNISPYIFLLPATVVLLLVFCYPMLYGFYTSCTHYDQYTGTTSLVGLQNYAKILQDRSFWNSMQRSVIWVSLSVFGQFVIGFAFALLLNDRWLGNRFMRVLVLIPWVMPGVSVALGWSLIFNGQFGLLNDTLLGFGLPRADWLANPNLAMVAVIIVNIWKAFPFVTVTMLARLAIIPDDLYDAAKMDGASALDCFRHVTLPQLRNVMLIIILVMVVWTFNSFSLVYVMTEGGPARGTEIVPVLVVRFAFEQFDYGLASSIAIIMALFNMIFTGLYIGILWHFDI